MAERELFRISYISFRSTYATFIPKFVPSMRATVSSTSCNFGSLIGLHVLTTSFVPNANVVAVPCVTSMAIRGSRMVLRLHEMVLEM